MIIQSSGPASCEQTNARGVNEVLSNGKRSLDGAYHAFKFTKYAQCYLADTMWRFNRRFDLTALVPRLLVAAARTRPWSEPNLRDVRSSRLKVRANQELPSPGTTGFLRLDSNIQP